MRWSILVGTLAGMAAALWLLTADLPFEDPLWWYANEAPPRLSVQGPAGPVRGTVEAHVRLEPADRASVVAATLDGQPLPVGGTRLALDTSRLPDGPHRLTLLARDTSRRRNEASTEWTFTTDNSGPTLDVQVSPAEGPAEGSTFVVRVRASEPVRALRAELEGRELRLQPTEADGSLWSLVGIPPEPAYRRLRLSVQAEDELGNRGAWERTYPLTRTRFPVEDLDFDPDMDDLAEAQVRAVEMARLMPIYRRENGGKRWGDGPFLVPVQGPVTTDFATRRSYNGRFPQDNHAGTDFGAPLGEPVVASADGVVAFAEALPVRGNTLVLDHGAGVYTTYAHLQRFSVAVGDTVRAGQLIGRVGSTGLSTGPHLHWELWVAEANVDPLEWTRRAYP